MKEFGKQLEKQIGELEKEGNKLTGINEFTFEMQLQKP